MAGVKINYVLAEGDVITLPGRWFALRKPLNDGEGRHRQQDHVFVGVCVWLVAGCPGLTGPGEVAAPPTQDSITGPGEAN